MLYKYSFYLALSSVILLSACANKPDRKKLSAPEFNMTINDDGSKRFVLLIENENGARRGSNNEQGQGQGKGRGSRQQGERPQGGGGGRGGQGKRQNESQSGGERGGRGEEQSEANYADERAKAIVLLEEKLTETAYCRNGYIELDYTSVSGNIELVGECQESASDEDKAKW